MIEIEELRKIHDAGLSYEKIGRELGVAWETVYRWLKGYNKPSDMAIRIVQDYLRSKNLDG